MQDVQHIIDDLSSFLLDFTEEVFEEIPEVDNVRSDLQEMQEEGKLDTSKIPQMIEDLSHYKENQDISDSINSLNKLLEGTNMENKAKSDHGPEGDEKFFQEAVAKAIEARSPYETEKESFTYQIFRNVKHGSKPIPVILN